MRNNLEPWLWKVIHDFSGPRCSVDIYIVKPAYIRENSEAEKFEQTQMCLARGCEALMRANVRQTKTPIRKGRNFWTLATSKGEASAEFRFRQSSLSKFIVTHFRGFAAKHLERFCDFTLICVRELRNGNAVISLTNGHIAGNPFAENDDSRKRVFCEKKDKKHLMRRKQCSS